MEHEERPVTANELSGTAHGAAVQAGSIEGGVHVYLTTDTPKKTVSPPPPTPQGWTDLPELPVEVRSLLRAQVQAGQKMPYRLPGARQPSLATVYVRQDLGSGAEDPEPEQPRRAPMLDGREQLTDPPVTRVVRSIVRPPSRTVRVALDGDDHVLVTGGPGQGKSTLSLRLAADAAGRWISPNSDSDDAPLAEPVVPLRLTARELAARLDLPFPEAMAKCVRVEYGALLSASVDAEVFSERAGGCRWLLLVDGLDEVAASADRDRLIEVLARWASDAGSPFRVVLTTRPIEGAALATLQRIGAARYELQPFDEEALERFAENWFDDHAEAHRFVRQLHAAHLDELVRVPLLATIAAIIFTEYSDRPLPDNQYELYESYLKFLRSGHPPASSPFDEVRGPLLEHLGRVRREEDTSLTAAACEWTAQHLPDLVGEWQDELITYLAATGPCVRRHDDLHFIHHSFAEHLAATAKARLLPEHFAPEHTDFAQLLHAARPRERGRHARAILLHFTRLHVAEADRLIAWLHSGGPDQLLLAARLLAAHAPAGVEVVDAFLVTVRAWAMTTQYPGHQILEQASRAAHHPRITNWLADLMRDTGAPWQSRIEAATALASRLRGAESPGAIALLQTVIDDAAVAVADRLAAAEALCDCGSDQRDVAERGLRSVLADPSATAFACRQAAVTLAGFDGTARVHAVEALTSMLDDPWTPDQDLVEAATGLIEIGIEFYERCADVFLTVLSCSRFFGVELGDAATGLASLGAHHLTEAVATLTGRITDRRLDRFDRISAADALAELGREYKVAAGEHLMALAAEFNVWPYEKARLAASLNGLGYHHQALGLLRTVLADQTAYPHGQLDAARTLADLGSGHQIAATKVFWQVADDPSVNGYARASALAELVTSGEPHRTPALASLRSALADRNGDPSFRCRVAQELVRLGPEFHSEVAKHMQEIVRCQADPDVRATAWRTLRNLGTSFSDRSSAALLALMSSDEMPAWESHRSVPDLLPDVTDNHASLADTLIAVLHNPTISDAARMYATRTLVHLGGRFHPSALDGVIALVRSYAVPTHEIRFIAMPLSGLGLRPRAELAETLRAMARDQHLSPTAVCKLAEALERLNHHVDEEVITALRDIVADDLVHPDVRGDAAVALARAVPEELSDLTTAVLRNDGKSVYSWKRQMRELVALGADVTPALCAVLADTNTEHRQREIAAATLAELRTNLRDEALAELRTQADDTFLSFHRRADAMKELVDLDPATRDDAIAHHNAMLNDESQPVHNRCEAAIGLAQLDPSFAETAIAALRRFGTSPQFTTAENGSAVVWLARLGAHDSPEVVQLGLSVARDPAATASVRNRIIPLLRGKARLETERALLTEHAARPRERVGHISMWEHRTLGEHAEAVLRDILTAVETPPVERVEAAAALADLSPKHLPEAVSLLEELSTDSRAVDTALDKLAKLRQERRRQVLAEAQRIIEDDSHSLRQRARAAVRILRLTSNPAKAAVEHMRQLVRDQRLADNLRIKILYELRYRDGLDGLRKIRDDERTRPASQRYAANLLCDHAVRDREAAARVLDAIATDTTCRPALRWRAASDLTTLGSGGRDLGIPALQALTADEALPTAVRVGAARALGNTKPDTRVELLRLLRGLRNTDKPTARLQVLEAIGLFDSGEGAAALHNMAFDQTLGQGVRLRAATAMAELRRDYRDQAAVVAKEVAYDEAVPRHIRLKAARALARWSDPCRADAHALFAQLNGQLSSSTRGARPGPDA